MAVHGPQSFEIVAASSYDLMPMSVPQPHRSFAADVAMWGGRLARLGMALSLAASLTALSAARAEEPKEEVLIGTFELRGRTAAPANSSEPSPHAETSAEVYRQAVGRLRAGDLNGGQRLLEVLVARFPQSPESGLARLRLAQLYSAMAPVAAQRVEHSAAAESPDTAAGQGDSLDGWGAEVRPRQNVTDRFRMEVGDRVFFSASSAELGSRARNVLGAQAAWLLRQPQADAVIEGHADEPGGVEENRRMAIERAEAVRQRLLEEGVPPERLKIATFGRSQRIAECDGPECSAQNRRTVTVVYPRGGEPPGRRVGEAGQPRHKPQSALTLDVGDMHRASR
jgi:peptidoglycan-associated lipoprotein